MTDQELLESADLKQLLHRLCRSKCRRPGDRRLRLFAAAFWRWQSTNLKADSAEKILRASALAEEWAEVGSRPAGMDAFRGNVLAEKRASTAAKRTAGLLQDWGNDLPHVPLTRARERMLSLFRCVFGNSLCPVALSPGWMNPTVASLARAAYDERKLPKGELDPVRLTVLADALEEAGASGEPVEHLRSSSPHVRGCWAVDLCLGLS